MVPGYAPEGCKLWMHAGSRGAPAINNQKEDMG